MNSLPQRYRTADVVASVLSLAVIGIGSVVVGQAVSLPGRAPVSAPAAPELSSSSSPARPAMLHEELGMVPITVRAGDQVATGVLADTWAGHQFAAMLPITVDLQDPFGQAKSGALPFGIDITGAARESHPITGGIYYWPDGADLAVFYDALGQAVPPPGLIRLGVIDAGLGTIASRGNVTATVQRAD